MRIVENPQSHLKTLQSLIAEEKKKAAEAKLHFAAPDDDQLIEKLRRAQSPMIYFNGWSGASAGGILNYTVGIYNPDPIYRSGLYAYVFVGPANVVPSVGEALATADDRFPKLTEPPFFGLSLAPGASANLSFSLNVPTVQASTYLGNTFLVQVDGFDVGTYLDRGCFPFRVI